MLLQKKALLLKYPKISGIMNFSLFLNTMIIKPLIRISLRRKQQVILSPRLVTPIMISVAYPWRNLLKLLLTWMTLFLRSLSTAVYWTKTQILLSQALLIIWLLQVFRPATV